MSDSTLRDRFCSYSTNLRFFSRIRRFIRLKTTGKSTKSSDRFNMSRAKEESEKKIMGSEGSCRTEEDDLAVLQRSVKRLHFGSLEDKDDAAKEIKRLAAEDLKTRKSLAALGVIPSLVSMLDSDVSSRRLLAIQALIELANGTHVNKALMVEAEILKKLPGSDLDSLDELVQRDFATLLVSISDLANVQFPIASSEMLPFLIWNLNSNTSIEATEACLGALHNLSTMLDSIGPLISNGVVSTLMRLCLEKESSEKALAILGNLVVTVMGKKAMENDPKVPDRFIEIMTWEEKPKCQELASYILMILAHQSSAQREKMAKLGIVPVLLEVALLGSPLAQKRALKILQWFKDERQTRMRAHSGPQTGRIMVGGLPVNQRESREGKKLMKNMVKQSLDKNMEFITRRANAATDSSKLKSYVISSSSSKSLPY
ncbi:U-box domain-containing protein 7-like [Macadamia integrifolia]|uniref:U-box domain-containing protein 7-like n=1 Tax=Macadamia integrifolia TaxID=60698 RepID=UPI001C528DC6|nr:U-box domain-containing protein 7-like [Macadamia integrifolia]